MDVAKCRQTLDELDVGGPFLNLRERQEIYDRLAEAAKPEHESIPETFSGIIFVSCSCGWRGRPHCNPDRDVDEDAWQEWCEHVAEDLMGNRRGRPYGGQAIIDHGE